MQAENDLSGTVQGPVVQVGGDIHGNVVLHGGEAAVPHTPHQVPGSIPQFVNRDAELSALSAMVGLAEQKGPPRIAVISGLPGVGKSMTVRRWVEAVRDEFPGGDLYVDYTEFRGHETAAPGEPEGESGAAVSAGLSTCLRDLKVEEWNLPAKVGELARRYRDRTAERRTLVVLDDVTQPAHVKALIPGAPGSVVLVTSQERLGELALDGARFLPLEPLDTDSGMRLLAELCGDQRVRAEAAAAAQLVELCAGLPTALHVAAARLVMHRRLTLGALAAELADEGRRLEALALPGAKGRYSVSAVFSVAYRALPDEAARLYRLLGLVPGRSFGVEVAAAAGGLDVERTQELLDVLDAASLVDFGGSDSADGSGSSAADADAAAASEPTKAARHAFHVRHRHEHFRFHDLVRLHARQCAAAEHEDPRAVVERVVEHYLMRAALADRAVMGDRLRIAPHTELLREAADPFGGKDGKQAALEWLAAERANALATLRAAAEHGLHRQTWQLAEALTALYLNHRHLADWIESGELGAKAAALDGQPAAEARIRALLSRPLMDLGKYERAREELEIAVARADEAGPEHVLLRGSVQEFLGRYWDRFDPSRAVQAYERAAALSADAGEERGVAIARYFLGCAHDAGGEHDRALSTLQGAFESLREMGDGRMAGRVLAAIGTAYDHLGRTAEAVGALEEAAAMLQERDAVHYEAQAREALADLAARTGDRELTRRHLARAMEIHEAGGNPRAAELRARLAGLAGSDVADPSEAASSAGSVGSPDSVGSADSVASAGSAEPPGSADSADSAGEGRTKT